VSQVAAPALVSSTPVSDERLDINTASVSDLNLLSGGARYGRAIARGRPYASVEDLASRRILTRAALERIKDQITVAGEAPQDRAGLDGKVRARREFTKTEPIARPTLKLRSEERNKRNARVLSEPERATLAAKPAEPELPVLPPVARDRNDLSST
jgi:hypothetical protein